MSLLVHFSAELKTWILHNLDRGCAPADVAASMIAQQFAPDVAHGLVDAFVQARSSAVAPPSDCVMLPIPSAEPLSVYHYETPRMAAGPVLRTADRDIPVVLRLAQPVLAVLEGVLSAGECDTLIALARHRMRPSTVVDPLTGQDRRAEHRDSEGMFFALQETPFIANLDRRIAEVMNCPVEHGEGLHVLHYGPGAKSTPHVDFLVPSNAANAASIARSGQRISSLVIYLNEVGGGGETVFPEVGLAVTPKKGNAVYFEYSNSLGQLDDKSVHAGAPVSEGEKWAMTKWMRARRFIAAR